MRLLKFQICFYNPQNAPWTTGLHPRLLFIFPNVSLFSIKHFEEFIYATVQRLGGKGCFRNSCYLMPGYIKWFIILFKFFLSYLSRVLIIMSRSSITSDKKSFMIRLFFKPKRQHMFTKEFLINISTLIIQD